MLVLSRKLGQKITIGEGIELIVFGVQGNRVKLGIAAPGNIRIVRSECRDSSPDEQLDPKPANTQPKGKKSKYQSDRAVA